MKNSLLLFVFFLFYTSIIAQVEDIYDIVEDRMNEAQKKAKDQADTDAGLNEIMDELAKKSKDLKFKEALGELTKAINEFSEESYTGKCLHVMGAYAELLALADWQVENSANPCKKKEWLGIEGLLLMVSGMINYCPTEFYNEGSPDENFKFNRSEYNVKIKDYFYSDSSKDMEELEQLFITAREMLQTALKKYNAKTYYDLPNKVKEAIQWHIERIYFAADDKNFRDKLPHYVLLLRFLKANQQLKLAKIPPSEYQDDGDWKNFDWVDFVGKMFRPEFTLQKTIEIAKESNIHKCKK